MLGSGAFACEAMEAAIANNAKHVTMICHERKRCVDIQCKLSPRACLHSFPTPNSIKRTPPCLHACMQSALHTHHSAASNRLVREIPC